MSETPMASLRSRYVRRTFRTTHSTLESPHAGVGKAMQFLCEISYASSATLSSCMRTLAGSLHHGLPNQAAD